VAANLVLLGTLSQEVWNAVGRMRAPLGMAPRLTSAVVPREVYARAQPSLADAFLSRDAGPLSALAVAVVVLGYLAIRSLRAA
jgi:hypothetical protein